jgi:hypothetical protein
MIRHGIPVFALVEESVALQYELYAGNRDNQEVDLNKLTFAAVDSLSVFRFIEAVRNNSVNNAIQPFRDFADIESYLKRQWAGMMFDFLSRQSEGKRVADTLETLTQMNERIELMSTWILQSVGTERYKLEAALYEEMMASASIRDLSWLQVRVKPATVLTAPSFAACAAAGGKSISDGADLGPQGIALDGRIGAGRLYHNETDFLALKNRLLAILSQHNYTVPSYLNAVSQSSAN